MRARLSDIALRARVSEATVSRVLNDKPGVSPDTRESVLAALDALGLERPARLRRRSAGLVGLVGLVVPELVNPIFPEFAQTIESALAQRGYTPVLCTQTPGGVTEDEYVEILLDRQVSGIVFVSGLHADATGDHERYRRLVARQLPIVLVNGYVAGLAAPFVSPDEQAAAELAVAYLTALGHRRIGLVNGPDRFLPVRRRIAGFRVAMRTTLGLPDAALDELISLSLFGVEGGEAATHRLLDAGVTGIVCARTTLPPGRQRAQR
jgi:alanine racemase